jgi:dynein heavy chain, axonemal
VWTPVVQALSTWASKWVYLFTHYLQDKVNNSISELYNFIDLSNTTLDRKVSAHLATLPACRRSTPSLPLCLHQVLGEVVDETGEQDAAHSEETPEETAERKAREEAEKRQALYAIMSCMRDVRKRADRTDSMFDPLKDTVALLQLFGIQLNEAVLKQLENAEFKWKGLKKKMLNRREQLAALQQVSWHEHCMWGTTWCLQAACHLHSHTQQQQQECTQAARHAYVACAKRVANLASQC